MRKTSFEETGKEDEFVNGYSGGTRTAPPVDKEADEEEVEYLVDENIDDIRIASDEEVEEEEIIKSGPKEYVRPDDYDLLTPDEQDKYDKLPDKHSYKLYKILGKTFPTILDERAEKLKKQYYKDEERKYKILENKEILEEPTLEGSEARTKIRQKYTKGMRGTDEADEEALLNETALQKYVLDIDNNNKIPIDSLLSKNKQFAPADLVIKTKGGNVKKLYEVKTVNYFPVTDKRHHNPKFYCPLNKIANLYGYPEGIKNEEKNYDRIKEIKSFKNAPSKLERKIFWTVLNRDEGDNVEDSVYRTKVNDDPEKAEKSFKDKVSYYDLNDKELKKDVVKYLNDKTYRPKDKPYVFEMSPVDGNLQMTIRFKRPTKITNKKYKTKNDYLMENIGFID
jgi:hypothetical protein